MRKTMKKEVTKLDLYETREELTRQMIEHEKCFNQLRQQVAGFNQQLKDFKESNNGKRTVEKT